ncbi:MAG: DUF4249 family protein [Candidatus Kapabacteria bacterium]|nr:DUF4249 family protein [Ignavibacteriota bacterium]MCW5884547.1 DUF4249 family protein [Candidatus Kapabacteria bacterium]
MKKLLFIIVISLLVISCEDPVPTDYIEDFVVEGLLIVDDPIQNITLMKTQPLNSIFDFDSSMVRDANVKIIGDEREFQLKFRTREDGGVGYYFDDTTYKVKSGVNYKLEITLNNGKFITGTTFTPPTTQWNYRPASDTLQFPLDTLNLGESDSISWQRAPGYDFYLISIENLDTLNYGIYLNPPTDEPNRRIYRPFGNPDRFREPVTIFPIPNTRTPIIWNAFRWFGKHRITIYVPDWNLLRWFLQAQGRGDADPLLTSVDGAIGYFGSASALRYDFFLRKNQP